MRTGTWTLAVCAAVSLHTAGAAAQGKVWSLAEVLEQARQLAPEIVSARLALEEARGRLIAASVRFPTNPQIDAALGNRTGPDRRFTDVEIGVGQAFEPGARRAARVAGATAAIAQGSASVDEVTRTILRLAASAYYRVLHATEQIKLLDAAHDLASRVRSTADRRFKAGDIAVLDVNIARASLARVRADREGAEASKALALGELRQLLGLGADISVDGSLLSPPETALDTALQTASARPELRALEAAIEEADAERQLGESLAKPEYGLGARYSREEGDQIVLGAMTVTLPVFAKGQGERAIASARATRLRAELAAARTRVQQEVRAAFDAFNRRLAAVRVLESDAIAGVDENEQLTTRSYEVGQLGLPELLLIRRELVETRTQYLNALLEAALARIDLDASAAVLR